MQGHGSDVISLVMGEFQDDFLRLLSIGTDDSKTIFEMFLGLNVLWELKFNLGDIKCVKAIETKGAKFFSVEVISKNIPSFTEFFQI